MSISESPGGGESRWQCRHCRKEFGVSPGAVFKFCPECRAPEQESDLEAVYCVNPQCKTKLFKPTQKICHECGESQPIKQAQQQPKPTPGHTTPTMRFVSISSTSSDVASEKATAAQRSQTTTTQASQPEGKPILSGSQSQVPASQHSTQSSFQGSRDSSSSPESTGGPQSKVLKSHQVYQPTDIPKAAPTSESTSPTSQQSFTVPPPTSTASTASAQSVSASNSQPHQVSNNTEPDGTHDKEKQMGKEEERKGFVPKAQEATEKSQEKGQGADRDKGASPSAHDQLQKGDGTQPQNPPTYPTVAASDQVCAL